MPQVLDELVRRQFHSWERNRRSSAAEAARPCVALSRLPGAGAAELGQRLAERLGYAFFGIEIVDHIARRTGARAAIVPIPFPAAAVDVDKPADLPVVESVLARRLAAGG